MVHFTFFYSVIAKDRTCPCVNWTSLVHGRNFGRMPFMTSLWMPLGIETAESQLLLTLDDAKSSAPELVRINYPVNLVN